MNRITKGLLTFSVYAILCVVLLSLAFGESSSSIAITDEGLNLDETTTDILNDKIVEDSLAFKLTDENTADSTVSEDSLIIENTLTDEFSSLNEKGSPNSQLSNQPARKFNVYLPDGKLLIQCNAFTTVYKDQARVKIPYACREYGISIKLFLEKNPRTSLKITGFSDPSEIENTGRNRSDYLKKLLVNSGIPADRIIASSSTNALNFSNDTANGGILMEINGVIVDNSSFQNIPEATITKELPITTKSNSTIETKKFTTGFQGNTFYGDQNFIAYTATVKNILGQNKNAKLYCYSYTDKGGDADENFATSRDNAGTVRKILIQNGISPNKILSIARGEQHSGTSGSNRCILIVIK